MLEDIVNLRRACGVLVYTSFIKEAHAIFTVEGKKLPMGSTRRLEFSVPRRVILNMSGTIALGSSPYIRRI